MMDFVLNLLEQSKTVYVNDPVLAPAIQASWDKITKYYQLTSDSPAYAAAVVLDPSLKWQYFQEAWELAWIPEAKAAVQKLWEDEYCPPHQNCHSNKENIDPALQTSQPGQASDPLGRKFNAFNQFLISKKAKKWVFSSPLL
jgi:hypothetical protein